MDALYFSFVDLLVLAVIGISAVFAAWRGFVQESLSIFAWAAAAFAALYFGPSVVPLLEGEMSEWVAIVAGYAGVFLVVVIPLSFMSYRFSENVRRSPIHALDRALGFFFGIVRGLVIVGAVYLVFTVMVPIRSQPSWVTSARLLPVVQSSGEVLLALIPDQKLNKAGHASAAARAERKPAGRDAAGGAQSAHTKKTPKKTYGAKERRALDKLIEATADGGGKKP